MNNEISAVARAVVLACAYNYLGRELKKPACKGENLPKELKGRYNQLDHIIVQLIEAEGRSISGQLDMHLFREKVKEQAARMAKEDNQKSEGSYEKRETANEEGKGAIGKSEA